MKGDNNAAGCCGCLGLLGIVAAIAAAAWFLAGEPADPASQPTPAAAATPVGPTPTPTPWRPPTADEAAEKCLSGWDGSHRATNERIKAELRSPDSFEHVKTLYRTTLTQGGRILVLTVEFSAENAFGARLRGTGFGDVDVQTCQVVRGGLISGG